MFMFACCGIFLAVSLNMASIGNHFGRLLLRIGKIFALFLVFEVYSLQHVDAELTGKSPTKIYITKMI